MQKRRRRLLWVGLLLVGLYLAWGVWPYVFGSSPIRWTTTTRVTYPGGIEVRTTALHEVFAFIFGPHLAWPFPFHHVEAGYEQAVFVNGSERVRFRHDDSYIYPSPSGKYVVIEKNLFTTPPRIYHMLSSAELSWNKDEIQKGLPGQPVYMVTFQFVQWVDEDHFLLEVGGHGFPDCRQTWLVDARTGSHEPSTSTSRPAIRPWG